MSVSDGWRNKEEQGASHCQPAASSAGFKDVGSGRMSLIRRVEPLHKQMLCVHSPQCPVTTVGRKLLSSRRWHYIPLHVSTFFCSLDQSWHSVPTPAWYLWCDTALHGGNDVLPIKQHAPTRLNFCALLLFCLGVLQLRRAASKPICRCIHTNPNYSF